MPADDWSDDDDAPRGLPLPPDDRLWRHPSELSSAPFPVAPPVRTTRRRPGRILLTVGVAGTALAVLALSGRFTGGDPASRDGAMLTTILSALPTSSAVGATTTLSMATTSSSTGAGNTATTTRRSQPTTTTTAPRSPAVVVKASLPKVTARTATVLPGWPDHLLTSATGLAVGDTFTVPAGGRTLTATVIGIDRRTDVALVRATAEVGDPTTAPTATVDVGDPVWVGDDEEATTVAAVDRRVVSTDQQIHPGLVLLTESFASSDAGSPVIDADGNLIGLATSLTGTDGRLRYVVPIDTVLDVVTQLLRTGKVSRPWLGLKGTDLDQSQRSVTGAESGTLLTAVRAGGPAAAAGLAVDDVITAIDGTDAPTMDDLLRLVADRPVGSTVTVTYVRDGETATCTLTLGEQPADEPTGTP